MRRTQRLSVVLLSGATVLGISGCSTRPEVPQEVPAEYHGVDLRAELNPATGAVVLPFDRFALTDEESDLLTSAGSVLVSQCAQAKGVRFVPAPLTYEPVMDSEAYFGPWTADQARRFGFVNPMTDADLAANGVPGAPRSAGELYVSPNVELSDADWEILATCEDPPGMKSLGDARGDDGPWYAELYAAREKLTSTGEAQDLIDELEDCFRAEGLEPARLYPGFPNGVKNEITQTQVELALQVVECKDKIDFTERMAQVEARLQAPIIMKYADEIVAKREQIDAAVEQARALVATAGLTK